MKFDENQQADRTQLVDQTIQALIDFVLTQKFADIPNWMGFDLTVSQLRAIYLLAFQGPFTISELARLLEIGNPAASILVQQLVQQDLAERSEDPNDRRRTLVFLTSKGAELVRERGDRKEAKARRWLNLLSIEELAGLHHGLQALVTIIQSEQSSPRDLAKVSGSPLHISSK